MLYFWNPDDLLIPNMMIDTSPWSSCSRRSPWLACSGHTISSTGPSVSPFWDFYVLCFKTRSRYQLRPGNPSVTGLLRWDWWRGDHPRDNLNQATPEILMKSTAGLSRELWVGPRFGWQSFSGLVFSPTHEFWSIRFIYRPSGSFTFLRKK